MNHPSESLTDRRIRRLSVLIDFLLMAIIFTLAWIGIIAVAGAQEVTVTSYNPKLNQTDDSPCIGASGRNLCTAAREGDRTIALSRDLLKTYAWHDKVKLTSDVPQCNGVYSVEDTMSKRHTKRADLFTSPERTTSPAGLPSPNHDHQSVPLLNPSIPGGHRLSTHRNRPLRTHRLAR